MATGPMVMATKVAAMLAQACKLNGLPTVAQILYACMCKVWQHFILHESEGNHGEHPAFHQSSPQVLEKQQRVHWNCSLS